MNKHLFKSLQKDKRTELDKLYNQYKCFWSWYYNSNVTAREAYHYTFEED